MTPSWWHLLWFKQCPWPHFHTFLSHKLSAYRLWQLCQLIAYLYYSFVWIYVIYLEPFEVLSRIPQAIVLGPLLFNIFIYDLCNFIKPTRYFLMAIDINIFQTVTPATDCTHLQSHSDSIHSWCAAHSMKPNTGKTRVIKFTRKINAISHITNCVLNVNLYNSIKDQGVLWILNSEL
jgi:hypothetical protein